MADDNNKKKQYTEEQKKYLQNSAYVSSPEELKKRGIPLVGPPIRKGASADSTGYFAKKVDEYDKMESNYINKKKQNIPKEITDRPKSKWNDTMSGTYEGILGKIRDAGEEAKDNYFRQGDKGDKGVILNYDKDGHFVGPFEGKKEAKKEIKPAAIVAPVKRPSEAVMKKVTGK